MARFNPAMSERADSANALDLANLWERDQRVRERVRQNQGKLVTWPLNAKGKPMVCSKTMASLGMNAIVLQHVAAWWCPQHKKPKTFCLPIIKKQASILYMYVHEILLKTGGATDRFWW